MRATPPDYREAALLSDLVPAAAVSLGAGLILDEGARRRAVRLALDSELRVAVVVLIDPV